MRHILLAATLLLAGSIGAAAQKRAARGGKKPAAKTEATATALQLADMAPATARLQVIDSVVCDREDFFSHIPLSKDCGEITTYDTFFAADGKRRGGAYVYVNEFADKCFYNDSTASGKSQLYTAEKIGGKWQRSRLVDELGNEYENVNYPYLMPDGVTLYFSATNKGNSFGGRDIFMTRLNSDSMKFYKPENAGLPYNSTADDICCIIDDMNQLGWLVSDRFQPKGKVCVYTFIPTSSRWTDGNPSMPEKRLEALARLTSIKDTWADANAVKEAKNRLAELKKSVRHTGTDTQSIAFPVNDNTVYRSVADFKSPTGRELYTKLTAMKKQMETDGKTLDIMRQAYSKAAATERNRIGTAIMKLEDEQLSLGKRIKELEKKIRNAENLL